MKTIRGKDAMDFLLKEGAGHIVSKKWRSALIEPSLTIETLKPKNFVSY